MLGYDWRIYFWAQDFRQYPPWVGIALAPLLALPWRAGLSLLNALLLMTVAIGVAREVYRRYETVTWAVRREAWGAVLLALCTPSVFILLWVGNIEAVALWGMIFLPVGVVWLLLKPHLGVWAILSRRTWIIWAAVFGVLTLVIWPGWPLQVLGSVGDRIQHPSAFGWASLGWPMIPIGLFLLSQSIAEPLILMAAGCFLSPFLMPQHFALFTPAFGKVRGYQRLALWGASWLMLIPVIFTGPIKWLALGYPLVIWWLLRPRPQTVVQPSSNT